MPPIVTTHRPRGHSRLKVRFIVAAGAMYFVIAGGVWLMIRLLPAPKVAAEAMLPKVFWLTTGLLAAGSCSLQRGVWLVQREKQRPFRRSLVVALFSGGMFVTVQSYGLSLLIRHQQPGEAETGANAFLTALAALHAMHFTLALLCLIWVTLGALADRYDHESYWGVKLCALFWHALGAVWMAILMAFLIAANMTASGGATSP